MKAATLVRWTLAGVGISLATACVAAVVLTRWPEWLTAHEND